MDELKSTQKNVPSSAAEHSKGAESSMENVDGSKISLEEGEIDDSFDSLSEVRRSPRKHPSSQRDRDQRLHSDSRSSRGSVKRRLDSPPSRAKRTRLSPARNHDSSRSSKLRPNEALREGRISSHSPIQSCRDRSDKTNASNDNSHKSFDRRDNRDRRHPGSRSNSDTGERERRSNRRKDEKPSRRR